MRQTAPGKSAAAQAVAAIGPETPLSALKGIGPQRVAQLERLHLRTVADALVHLPSRHEDRTQLTPLGRLTTGDGRTCAGTIAGIAPPPRGRPRVPLTVTLRDASGFLKALWFNQPYLARVFQRGQSLVVHGRVDRDRRGGALAMQVKDYEIITPDDDEPLHTGRLVPVYSVTEGLSTRVMRVLMKRLVDEHAGVLPEALPAALRERRGLAPVAPALRAAHFPESEEERVAARRRLAFEEFFLLELGLAIRRQREGRRRGLTLSPPGKLAARLREALPYRLTGAQERVWGEIRQDMAAPYPMNRLLQGDVGSGKTVVAALAMLTAIEAGYQAALMAPTEILAEQHLLTLRALLAPIGVTPMLLTNAVRGRARTEALAAIGEGRVQAVIGTHALVQEAVAFARLGLAVVDEQHRFGVVQRAALRGKGEHPDVLVMTATPIPRTLALTLYGDLDLSVLDEMPPGRTPVRTFSREAKDRVNIYAFLRTEVQAGRQVYVVCPLVEESEKSDLQAATEMAERLRTQVFPDLTVGLLHGRMGLAEKDDVMRRFRAGEVHLLVATTVIEVGIDVPNASVMLVEHAERFGLSQLHQLRGRVGRGAARSFCILLNAARAPEALRRIEVMTESTDGFRIAEADLELRGPGDFFGVRQAGLPELRVADLVRDGALLEEARREAFALVARDPTLGAAEHRLLRTTLLARWRGKLDLASIG
jgi:ATP-dependent DNA helicase RecG